MSTDTSNGALRIRNIALILLIILPVAALGTRFGLWSYTVGLGLFALSLLGSLLIQIINAIWLLRKPASGTKSALRWASLFALPPLVLVALLLRNPGGSAGIHNISTDMQNPPQFDAAIEQRGDNSNPLAYSAEVAEIQRIHFPEIKTLFVDIPPADSYQKAVAVAEQLEWNIYAKGYDDEAGKGRIEAVQTTLWFGFKDDIVIRILETESGSQIDLRSVSRVGRGDMGANARRIAAFFDLYSQ